MSKLFELYNIWSELYYMLEDDISSGSIIKDIGGNRMVDTTARTALLKAECSNNIKSIAHIITHQEPYDILSLEETLKKFYIKINAEM